VRHLNPLQQGLHPRLLRRTRPHFPHFELFGLIDIADTKDHAKLVGPILVAEYPVRDLPQAGKCTAGLRALTVDGAALSTFVLAVRVVWFTKFDHRKRRTTCLTLAAWSLFIFVQHIRAIVFVNRLHFHRVRQSTQVATRQILVASINGIFDPSKEKQAELSVSLRVSRSPNMEAIGITLDPQHLPFELSQLLFTEAYQVPGG
jgi:hypothetical protein